MSTTHQRKGSKNTFMIGIDAGRDPVTGKRRRHWHTFTGSKKAAKVEAARLTAEVAGGDFVAPHRLSIEGFLKQWLAAVEPSVSPKTHERYTEICASICRQLGSALVQELEAQQISRAMTNARKAGRHDGGPLSPNSIKIWYATLKSALSWGVEAKKLVRNPITKRAVPPPRVPKTIRETYATGDTVKLLEALRRSEIHINVFMAARIGMRRAETTAIAWEDIDLDRGIVTVARSTEELNRGPGRIKSTKTERVRVLPVDQDVVATLAAHKQAQRDHLEVLGLRQTDKTLVCLRADGTPMSPRWVSLTWARLVKASGLPVRNFHHLRHAYATAMLGAGIHIKTASERLGHASVNITLDTYSHLLPSVQQEAADKIGEAFRIAAQPVASK
jgi:integrase